MSAPSVINPAAAKTLTTPFLANKRYVFCVVTDSTTQRAAYVEWPSSGTLASDSGGTLQVIPATSDGLTLPMASVVAPDATTNTKGLVNKAATLTATAQTTLVNNIGGSTLTTIPALVGAIYATDGPAIASALTTLTGASNTTAARLEDLIAKLKTSGALS